MSNKRRDRQQSRQEDAKERQEVRASRSNSDQIARLDSLLGKDVGAIKERARLAKGEKTPSKSNKMPKKKKAALEGDAAPAVKQLAKVRRAKDKANKKTKQ